MLELLAIGAVCALAIVGIALHYGSEAERQRQRELWEEYEDLRRSGSQLEAERIRTFCGRMRREADRRIELTWSDIRRLKERLDELYQDARERDPKKTLFIDHALQDRNRWELERQLQQLYAYRDYLEQYRDRVGHLAATATSSEELPQPPEPVLPADYPYNGKIVLLSAEGVAKGELENPWCGAIPVSESDGIIERHPDESDTYWLRIEGRSGTYRASLRKGELFRRMQEGRFFTCRIAAVERVGTSLHWDDRPEPKIFLPRRETEPFNRRMIPRTPVSVRLKHLSYNMRSATASMRAEEYLQHREHDDLIYIAGVGDLSADERRTVEAVVKAARTVRVDLAGTANPQPESNQAGPDPGMLDLILDFGQISLVCEVDPHRAILRLRRLGTGAGANAATPTRRWAWTEEAPELPQEEKEAFFRFIFELQDQTEKYRTAQQVSETGKARAFESFDYLQAVERAQQMEGRAEVFWTDLVTQGHRVTLSGVTFLPDLTVRPAELQRAPLLLEDGTQIGVIATVTEQEVGDLAELLGPDETKAGEDEEDEPVMPGTVELEIRLSPGATFPESGSVFVATTPKGAHLARQQWAMEQLRRGDYVNRRLPGLLFDPASLQLTAVPIAPEQEEAVRSLLAGEPPAVVEKVLKLLAARDCALVMGPPGTGKTTLLAALIRVFLHLNPAARIGVASQSHYAVDELFDRIAEHQPPGRLVRVGLEQKVAASTQPYMPDRHVTRYREQLTSSQPVSERARTLREEWLTLIEGQDDYLEGLFLQRAAVVGATTSGMGGQRSGLRHYEWDLLLVDEAGRLSLTELLVPAIRARRIVMVGDHRQLPPVADALLERLNSEEARHWADFVRQSQFEWLWDRYPDSHRIENTEQFRMARPIGDLVSRLFYEQKLKTPYLRREADLSPSMILVDVAGAQRPEGSSWENPAEILTAIQVIRGLRERLEGKQHLMKERSIVFLTPYAAQRRLAATAFGREPDLLPPGFSLECRSVEEYQGHEAAVVILSLVRTDGRGAWVQNRQRLNVALSRAKHCLVVLGNRSYWRRTADPEPLVDQLYSEGEQLDDCVMLATPGG
jgi:energy-coupling factor transporter ATP-binding protein EcfA2